MLVLDHPSRHRRGGRYPGLFWAIVRALWSDPAMRQRDIVAWAGVTKGAVSQHVGRLDRDVPAWRDDPGLLVGYYLRGYPGTKGRLTYWLGGETPLTSARRLSRAGLVVSGDVAADLLAPWRVPTHLVAYASRPLQAARMNEMGFTEWDPEHATLALIDTPADTWLFRQSTQQANDLAPEGVRTAHPLHVAYDLHRLGGSDRIDAARTLTNPPDTPR